MVKTANLNESSNSIFPKDKIMINENRDIINIKTVKKYLLISLSSKFILENTSLFMNTFLGLLKERIWLIEYFVSEKIFKNLKPELVEKNEPPIITNSKKIKYKFGWSTFKEKPILEILLVKDKKVYVKALS